MTRQTWMPGKSPASNSALRWWSSRPLFVALLAAVVFVLSRVAYKAVFGGTSGAPADETVLWSAPQIWLAGPFSSIHILGVVTLELLVTAAENALPFAALIIFFGLFSSTVDLRVLLRSSPRAFAGISMALIVALGMFTTFAQRAKRLRVARLLRGERSKLRTLVPLFEQSIEHAEWLAISMSSRGWGRSNHEISPLEPANGMSAIEVEELSITIANRPVLRDVNLSLERGTITVLTGATGSGKTTLLHTLRGLFADAETHLTPAKLSGRVKVFGLPASLERPVGLTIQHPELSFVAPTVRAELAFGAEQWGKDASIVVPRIAGQTGITHLLDRGVDRLSAGEQAAVAIAAACTSMPSVLLLDEPIADLDTAAVEFVACVLRELRDAGVTILVAEHRPEALAEVADHWMHIDDCRLIEGRVESSPLITERFVRDAESATITVLEGPNGSGKTTLLNSLALHRSQAVESVAFVPHRVEDLFFCENVGLECDRADATVRVQNQGTPMSTRARISRLLPEFDGFDQNPRDCSAGTRVVIAICLQLALGRPRLLLDEPTRGLDAKARAELVRVLREVSSQGVEIVVATHDEEFSAAVADQRVQMRDGRMINGEIVDGWLVAAKAGVTQ